MGAAAKATFGGPGIRDDFWPRCPLAWQPSHRSPRGPAARSGRGRVPQILMAVYGELRMIYLVTLGLCLFSFGIHAVSRVRRKRLPSGHGQGWRPVLAGTALR
jgi:hypothetical protein